MSRDFHDRRCHSKYEKDDEVVGWMCRSVRAGSWRKGLEPAEDVELFRVEGAAIEVGCRHQGMPLRSVSTLQRCFT